MLVLDQWQYFGYVKIMCPSSRRRAGMLWPGSIEPTHEHTPLFSHLINDAYVAPLDFRWYSADSEPELSEYYDEQLEEEEVQGDGSESDESGDGGDEEEGGDGAEESDSEATESDSSGSDDAQDQTHPRRLTKVCLPESSSKRQRHKSTGSEDEPKSDTESEVRRKKRERRVKQREDRPFKVILREAKARAQRSATIADVSSASTST
ncbi:hypothetical protein L1987_65127 [Smallanthus sonchifolius]|uniref:Uncharacterized protein n=1 Tax=Smallanthus sonchifolius TaxID=185202 RepID=A0ACB9BTG6_9ASTR|nr:hypothetical protein L1987_65127 [Smallanthus sonchifolius]